MDYYEAINSIEKDGFSWANFREYFPFDSISLRESSFQILVSKILEHLEANEKKELLLDMIDTQNCVFLEQVWLQNEQFKDEDQKPFPVFGHFISAQLQITSNIRYVLNLNKRDVRNVMLKLSENERLIDRITGPKKYGS